MNIFSEERSKSDKIYRVKSLTPVDAPLGRVKSALRFEGEKDCFTGEGANELSAKTDAARQAYETYSMRGGGSHVRILWQDSE